MSMHPHVGFLNAKFQCKATVINNNNNLERVYVGRLFITLALGSGIMIIEGRVPGALLLTGYGLR